MIFSKIKENSCILIHPIIFWENHLTIPYFIYTSIFSLIFQVTNLFFLRRSNVVHFVSLTLLLFWVLLTSIFFKDIPLLRTMNWRSSTMLNSHELKKKYIPKEKACNCLRLWNEIQIWYKSQFGFRNTM